MALGKQCSALNYHDYTFSFFHTNFLALRNQHGYHFFFLNVVILAFSVYLY